MVRCTGTLRLLALCVLLSALVPPSAPAIADGSRAVQPDLYIPSNEVYMSTGQSEIYAGYIVWFYVGICNRGPGVSSDANATLFDNGTPFATIPLEDNISVSEPINSTYFEYQWNTSGLLPGNHTILISVMDAAGDANISDNNVTRYITVLPGPPPPTSISVNILEPTLEAAISETTQGTVIFKGTVSLELPPGVLATVHLETRVDAGWSAQASPSVLVIADDSLHSFKVSVIVPQATPSNIVACLTVEARTTNLGDELATSCYANITVKPYYRLLLESDMPYKEVEPGEPASFDIKCWNTGNSRDQFNITIDNRANLEKDGWKLTLNKTVLEMVYPNEYARFRLTATPPRGLSLFTSEQTTLILRVSSAGAERAHLGSSQTFALYVNQKGVNKTVASGIATGIALVIVAAVAVAWQSRRKRRAPPAARHVP